MDSLLFISDLFLCLAVTGRPCVVNGLVAADGTKWDDECNTCQCKNGKVSYTKV